MSIVTKNTNQQQRKACNRCKGIFKISTGYYKIMEPNDNFPDQHLNVCKRCMQAEWEDETSGFYAFLDFLRLADIPYKHDIYNSIEKKPDYLKRVRLSYTNYRFKDSDPMVEQKSEIQVKTGNLKELTPEQMEECAVFWGAGYTESEYIYLMSQYEKYTKSYIIDNPVMEDLVTKIIQTDLNIRKAHESGSDASKYVKTYQDLLATASLRPSDAKAAAENEANTFGTFIRGIEDNMPVAEPLPEYTDVDGIVKYVKALFTAPMAASLGVKNPFPKEYEEVMSNLSIDTYEEARGVDSDG